MQAKECIAIVSPTYNTYSETFINNHINFLPGKKIPVYSFGHDAHFGNKTTLLRMNKFARLFRFLERRIKGISLMDQEIRSLFKILRKERVSCVLAEYGVTGAKLVQACKYYQIPLVVHFHGYDASKRDILELYENKYRVMFEFSKAIIAVSSDMKKKLIAFGALEDKVKCIPYGIDLSEFGKKRKSQTTCNFLAVGRFVEKKAPYLTILAFSEVAKRVAKAKLFMVGDGPLLPICKQLVRSLDISNKVEFKGILTNQKVAELMEQTFCFVQHSVTAENGDAEGTPLAILEASASNLPIVSTKHAGIKDAVKHGETGFLVDEGDIQDMAKYMIHLAENIELAETFGIAGRKWMEQNYDIKKRINELWEVIK
ncbi:glycosyltransferase [Catalinimonas sp. 4WD22]|uniref:glycosyltransferase n=1 Tax=Catalinimonas locisalis TaxID=3133978 RepID=UPI0031019EF9